MKQKTAKKKPVEVDIYERDKYGLPSQEKPEFRNKPGLHIGPLQKYGGPGNGYTLHLDGSYELAPCQQKAFEDIACQIDGIQVLLRTIQDHAQERLSELERRRAAWFRDVAAEVYRPDDVMRALYAAHSGRLTFKDPEPPKEL